MSSITNTIFDKPRESPCISHYGQKYDFLNEIAKPLLEVKGNFFTVIYRVAQDLRFSRQDKISTKNSRNLDKSFENIDKLIFLRKSSKKIINKCEDKIYRF